MFFLGLIWIPAFNFLPQIFPVNKNFNSLIRCGNSKVQGFERIGLPGLKQMGEVEVVEEEEEESEGAAQIAEEDVPRRGAISVRA